MSRGAQVYSSGGLQGGSMEPAYKKTKLAHLRVKVPGGVRIPTPPSHLSPSPKHLSLSLPTLLPPTMTHLFMYVWYRCMVQNMHGVAAHVTTCDKCMTDKACQLSCHMSACIYKLTMSSHDYYSNTC